MSVRESCDKILLLQAEFDGELDAAQSVAITGHRQSCDYCHEAWLKLQASRQAMRHEASYHPASDGLRHDLMQRLAAAGLDLPTEVSPAKPARLGLAAWWRSFIGFGLGAAVAASAAMLFFQPLPASDMSDLVLASHIRSLQPGHLVDIASNNQHNVKPWFDGKLDFAPPVKNLSDQGFPLAGGRLDYLQDRGVAALVYEAGLHRINLLIWPSSDGIETSEGSQQSASGEPHWANKGGYTLVHWRDGEMTIWAVSDLNPDEFRKFITLWRAHD
jgi:anti-sigma factor RsiW